MSERMTGGMALARGLLEHGIDTLFTLPGAQLDPFFASLHDLDGAIRLVVSRHEQGAAYMALGAARSTGRPAAYAVVPGPGWLNTGAALATAYGSNAPVLSISGQIVSTSIGRGIGELHELPDQLAIARGLTKSAERIDHPALAPAAVAAAFAAMASGRSRPAYLEMAPDVMAMAGMVGGVSPRAVTPVPVDPTGIDAAAAILAKAVNPVIFVGGGALGASVEVTALAEKLQAPVVSLRMGRGVVDDRNPLAMPWAAGHELWKTADAVIAIGTRLDFPRRHWGEDAGLPVIRIDIDPNEIARLSAPAVALVADAADAAKALMAALPGRSRAARPATVALKSDTVAGFERDMPGQMAFLRAIRGALPEDGIFVDELTQIGYASWSWFPTYAPRNYISSGYQGTLGYGFTTALGAKVANPDRAVVSVTGDGGFMFGVQELATAVQHGIPLVTILFRDNKFGNVQRIQKERYGGRVLGSDLRNPDFVALANSFGARGLRCHDAAELGRALPDAFACGEPVLIEVPVGDFPSPWPHIVKPKVRGV